MAAYSRMSKPYKHLGAGVFLLVAMITVMQLRMSITPLVSNGMYSLAIGNSQKHDSDLARLHQHADFQASLASFATLESSNSNASSVKTIEADMTQWIRRQELLRSRTCPEMAPKDFQAVKQYATDGSESVHLRTAVRALLGPIARQNSIVLTFSSIGYGEFAHNLRMSMQYVGLCHLCLVALDEQILEDFSEAGYCVLPDIFIQVRMCWAFEIDRIVFKVS